jgi:hypothetical protein
MLGSHPIQTTTTIFVIVIVIITTARTLLGHDGT